MDCLDRAQVGELVERLFRKRYGQIVAHLTRLFGPGELDLAEEAVQEAMVKALQKWPFHGVPQNPGGWLFEVARNSGIDSLRRHGVFLEKLQTIARGVNMEPGSGSEESDLRDDELSMVYLCCHPELPRDASVALALKTVGGFSVAEIARGFLAEEPTIAQRLVRAKRLLRERAIRFELPRGSELRGRNDAVLEVLYLMFSEGHRAHGGERLIRVELCREALRLAELVAAHPATTEPRVHALAALLAFQSARLPARVDEAGELVVFEEQDRELWDRGLIALGFEHFERSAEGRELSPYHLEAAIAAVYARAALTDSVDWREILSLYDQLLELKPSPVVALNRAVALAKVEGPEAGLEALRPLESERVLESYYLLPAVEGLLRAELGDREGAKARLREALERPCSDPERRHLERKLAALGFPEG
jgi:RNA polymerase sigma-70 factor (ECF subfamily)